MGGSKPASPRGDAEAAGAMSGAADLFKAAFEREGAGAISAEHAPAIARVCIAHAYMIAIRSAGADTIRRIGQGAKPKPHDIRDKTIKERSLADAVRAGARFTDDERRRLLSLSGYAARWSHHRPVGLMAAADDLPDALRPQLIEIGRRPGLGYLPLDDAFAYLVTQQGDPRCFFTGDYDLHEAFTVEDAGLHRSVPDRSPAMFEMLDRLNEGIGRGRPAGGASPTSGTYRPGDRAMFQHGPQASYVVTQRYEAGAPSVEAALDAQLAREDAGVLVWCDSCGTWYLTRGIRQHDELRRILGLSKPPEWSGSDGAS